MQSRNYAALLSVLIGLMISIGCGRPNDLRQTAGVQKSEGKSTQTGSKETSPPIAESDDAKKSTGSVSGMGGMGKMKFPAAKDMKFKDQVQSNVPVPDSISDIEFTNKDGSTIKLADFLGKKNVVLVFTEGFNGMLCPFCQTQTSRLVANYEKFKDRNCEVIVVYPGPEDHLDEFVEAALKTEKDQVDLVPFPIVLDKEFAATNYFDIHSMHAHPSTYLIDKKGGVQFAYVGTDMTADRPSVKAIIEKLDKLEN